MRVLYVDDEAGLLEIGKIFLEKEGEFSVNTVLSASAALEILQKEPYDAIISDYQMPEMDGLEFLKKVRSSGNTIPFILFTGRGREEVVIEAINNGADFYLQKGGAPTAQFAELAHKIRQAVTRKQAEAAHSESVQRFRCLFESSRDSILTLEPPQWKFTSGNPAALHLFLAKDMTELTTRDQGDLSPVFQPDGSNSKEKAREMIETALRNGSHLFEWTHRRFNGEIFPASILLSRMEFAGTVSIQAAIRDITKQKIAEQALQKSEANLQVIMANTNDIIASYDRDFRLIMFNRSCSEVYRDLFGVEIAQGLRMLDLFPESQRSFWTVNNERALAGEVFSIEFEMAAPDGSPRIFEAFFNPIWRKAEVVGFSTMTRDITARKRGEDELRAAYEHITASDKELRGQFNKLLQSEQRIRESEEKFRTFIETSTDGLMIIDVTGTILAWNPAAEQIFGIPAQEALATNILDLQIRLVLPEHQNPEFTKDLRSRFAASFTALFTRTAPLVIEVEILNAYGNRITIQQTLFPMQTTRGNRIGCISRDITAQKAAETEAKRRADRAVLFQKALVRLATEDAPTLVSALNHITETCADILDVERVSIWMRSGDGDHLTCNDLFVRTGKVHSSGSTLHRADYPRYFAALWKNRAIVADDAETHEDTHEFVPSYLQPLGIRSMLDAPLRSGREVNGVLCCEHTGFVRKWNIDEQDIVAAFADFTAMVLELDQRRKLETDLRKSESRYRELAELLPQIVFEMDKNFTITFVNRRTNTAFGYSPEETASGFCALSILDESQHGRVKENVRRMVAGEPFEHTEYTFRRKDGSTFPGLIYADPIFQNNELTGFRGIIIDITERKQQEVVVREKNLMLANINELQRDFADLTSGTHVEDLAVRKLRQVSGAAVTLFSIYDPAGRTLQVTSLDIASGMLEKAVQLLGKRPESMKVPVSEAMYREITSAVVGRRDTLTEVSFGQIPPLVSASIQKLLGIDHFVGVAYVIGRELYGTSILAMKPGQPDPSHEFLESFAHIVAVSLRRQRAETGLRESEEILSDIIEKNPMSIQIVDREGFTIRVNPAFMRLFGSVPPPDFSIISDLVKSHPELENHISRVKSGEPVNLPDMSFNPHDIYPELPDIPTRVRAIIFPLNDRHGEPQRFVFMHEDITEQRQAEEALRQANRKLNLLSGITRHDIKNQLLSLNGFLEISKKYAGNAEKMSEFIAKEARVAKTMERQISFTREYEAIGVKTPVWQDFSTLVRTAAQQVLPVNVIVKNDVPAGFEVFADPLIVKVGYNLVDNAMRHGGKITTIRFSVEDRTADQVIVCEDDGVGVPAEEKEQIFARGFGKNTGMGLFLVREILSITGITITETGEPGKGARFEMMVPKGAWRNTGKSG